MSLAYRIAAGFLLLLLPMVALAAYHLTLVHRLRNQIEAIANPWLTIDETEARLDEALTTLGDRTRKLEAYREVTEGEDLVRSLDALRSTLQQDLDRLLRLPLKASERIEVDSLLELWEAYRLRVALFEQLVAAASEAQAPQLDLLVADLDRLHRQMLRIRRASRQALRKDAAAIRQESDQAELVAQLAALAALFVAMVASLVVSASVVRPLGRLTRGTRELARGNFSARATPGGSAEMVSLAEDFNRMAERLGALDQLKKDLVSNVSHDLKAPLASMQETTRLLLDELPGPLTDKQRRLLTLHQQSAERLSRMIADLLDLSRLEGREPEERRQPEDLRALLTTAVEELQNLAREKKLKVHLEVPMKAILFPCHGPSLVQAFQNLVSNAVNFTPPGGEIGARLEEQAPGRERWWWRRSGGRRDGGGDERSILVEVWDSGPGVPEEHKERIFDRFHRVDPERKGQQGTGLGLAIARAIVLRHGGSLWVEDRPGGGSSFRMLLSPRQPRP
jgi:two-component system sensor histidine kinase GlrK